MNVITDTSDTQILGCYHSNLHSMSHKYTCSWCTWCTWGHQDLNDIWIWLKFDLELECELSTPETWNHVITSESLSEELNHQNSIQVWSWTWNWVWKCMILCWSEYALILCQSEYALIHCWSDYNMSSSVNLNWTCSASSRSHNVHVLASPPLSYAGISLHERKKITARMSIFGPYERLWNWNEILEYYNGCFSISREYLDFNDGKMWIWWKIMNHEHAL